MNEKPPNSIKQTLQSSGVPIARYTFDTVELMKELVNDEEFRRQLDIAKARLAGATVEEATARFPKTEMLVFDISFDAIRDPEERRYFKNLPTSFVLEDEQVDQLREIASELMRQSPGYQEVISIIGAERTD